MNLSLFAKALGRGIEKTAHYNFDSAKQLAGDGEYQEYVNDDVTGESVQMEITAIQELVDHLGKCVELCVMVTDGQKEMKAYFYARPDIPVAN